ncbi:hypothetical protein B0I72DRAFT_135322 [Yarrowia lipolytica]|jgi:curved DNA-binding protein CbpA|uniref:Uncharacterized protein n=1 Tax=Yarrowia lipolytica TaxID=4952 RepID=A0A371CF15_YARLL|nr:hypothetical protein B0I71DRAFT_126819 [Yarrowia lipolytica]RDW34085.1 hypothetical protein B0I72DRAFT_135322 [Yarrowia lipolytica]RDW40927.1 hypothetical protein B0I73DRAFT_129586 [Yarrowia lipolytica]RDW46398.1 hypothetical protein B0I74DRAFT_137153 [Yarrowia lipolytica]RDW52850.1 hypothetical protein B0I75DRAFT_137470 [Yarrowia lipolytica]
MKGHVRHNQTHSSAKMLVLYEILNVPVNAGGFDISQAYRTRCLQLIKLLGKSDAYLSFYAVSDAYQILRVPQYRNNYLACGDDPKFFAAFEPRFIDAIDLFTSLFGLPQMEPLVCNASTKNLSAQSAVFQTVTKIEKELYGKQKSNTKLVLVKDKHVKMLRRMGWDKNKVNEMLKGKKNANSQDALQASVSFYNSLIDADFASDVDSDDFSQVFTSNFQQQLAPFRELPFGADYCKALGSAFMTISQSFKEKLEHSRLSSMFGGLDTDSWKKQHAELAMRLGEARDLCLHAAAYWRDKHISGTDQVNLCYAACVYQIILNIFVRDAVIIAHDCLERKGNRKAKLQRAKRLWAIGNWMVSAPGTPVPYEDTLHEVVTITAQLEAGVIRRRTDPEQKALDYSTVIDTRGLWETGTGIGDPGTFLPYSPTLHQGAAF